MVSSPGTLETYCRIGIAFGAGARRMRRKPCQDLTGISCEQILPANGEDAVFFSRGRRREFLSRIERYP